MCRYMYAQEDIYICIYTYLFIHISVFIHIHTYIFSHIHVVDGRMPTCFDACGTSYHVLNTYHKSTCHWTVEYWNSMKFALETSSCYVRYVVSVHDTPLSYVDDSGPHCT